MYSLSFAPLVPVWLLAGLALLVLVAAGAALALQRGRGVLRAFALLALLFALGDPSLVREEREPVKDVVAVVVDRSGSNRLADRTEQTARARAALERQLASIPQVEPRFVEVGDGDGANDGTRLFEALNATLADVPAERVAGALFITDGIVHDMPAAAQALGLKAPLHALVTGREAEIDRRVTLLDTPRFGIVGRTVNIRLKVDEKNGTGTGRLTVRRDGEVLIERAIRTGEPLELSVRVDRGGPNLIEIEVDALPNELTTANNRAVVTIEGVRDKLRVLLVSGEPHAGERTWRNLLKSDANIDLVHFTILRPPEKQDGTPINELSLIAFPVRDLFQTKIKEFDLIIFDRYANTTILPMVYFENIVRYVREGGALMVAAGPEFSGTGTTLSRTPLAAVLPAQPDGRTIEEAYKARITDRGKRHPVTRDLAGSEVEPPRWGEWLRLISARASEGDVVMSGPGDRPLLITSREGKGRVGLFLSDHAWLWARGYREGGPHIDLLRRLSHWLMKEPSLSARPLATIPARSPSPAPPVRPVRCRWCWTGPACSAPGFRPRNWGCTSCNRTSWSPSSASAATTRASSPKCSATPRACARSRKASAAPRAASAARRVRMSICHASCRCARARAWPVATGSGSGSRIQASFAASRSRRCSSGWAGWR